MLIDLVARTDPVPEIPTGAHGSLDVDGYLDRMRDLHRERSVPLRAQSIGAPDVPRRRERAGSVGAPAVGPAFVARPGITEAGVEAGTDPGTTTTYGDCVTRHTSADLFEP